MTVFVKQRFDFLHDCDAAICHEGHVFRRCEFVSCRLSIDTRPEYRSTVRGCQLVQCAVHQGSSIWTAVIEETLVDGLETKGGPVFLHGPVFKHVVVRGRIGRLVVGAPYEMSAAFLEANAAYYQNVDWALDLTECEATELDVSWVPGHLIRRDPTTQILVTRERAMAVDWRKIPLDGTTYDIALGLLVDQKRDSEVLVAPHRHRSFSMCIEAQKRLRDAGVAEPD